MVSRETTLLESASAEDSFAAIGAVLRAARIDRGLAIDDVAQDLRYSKNYIRHLEDGDFDLLPGATYVAGYLRSYGQLLGIDGPALIARYQRLLNPIEMRPTHKFPIPGQRPQRSGAVVASFMVIIAVAGYVGWYWAEKPGLEALMPQQETAQIQDAAPLTGSLQDEISLDDDATLASNLVADNSVNDDPMPTGDADTTTAALAPLDSQETLPVLEEGASPADDKSDIVAQVVAEDATTTQSETNGEAATETAFGNAVENVAETEGSAPVVGEERVPNSGSALAKARDEAEDITLRAVASSWVEIVRNDGEEVMTKLMRKGDSYIIDGGENLYLSTGNAGGLEFVLRDGSVLSAGDVGEILRDLPLKPAGLIDNL